jgi:hypothetical protein
MLQDYQFGFTDMAVLGKLVASLSASLHVCGNFN